MSVFGIAACSYVFFSDFEELIRKIIIEDTKSLRVDPGEIDKFLSATRKSHTWDSFSFSSSFSKKEFIKWSYYLSNPLIRIPYETKYRIYRSQIVGLFLLSTNFFANKMDPKKPVRFGIIYNPYFTPCANPFSNLHYPNP